MNGHCLLPMNKRTPLALLLVIALVSILPTGLSAQAPTKRVITPQDLWAMKRLSNLELSPDGGTAAVVVQEWNVEKNKPTANIWLVPVAGGEPRKLTTAQASDGSPVWSPDGKRIAFVSKRGEDKAAALYVIRTDGGEAEKILELPVRDLQPTVDARWRARDRGHQLHPDIGWQLEQGRTLAAMEKEIKRRKDAKMTAKVTEDRQYRYFDHWITDSLASRLLLVNATTKEIKDLTPDVGPPVPDERHGGLRPVAGRRAGGLGHQHHTATLQQVS